MLIQRNVTPSSFAILLFCKFISDFKIEFLILYAAFLFVHIYIYIILCIYISIYIFNMHVF